MASTRSRVSGSEDGGTGRDVAPRRAVARATHGARPYLLPPSSRSPLDSRRQRVYWKKRGSCAASPTPHAFDEDLLRDDELTARLMQAPVGFATAEGPEMVFTAANARYLAMVSRTDVVGKRWIDVFTELVGTSTHDAVRAACQGETVELHEFSIPLVRDGETREGFFTFSLYPVHDAADRPNGFVVIAVDVTDNVVRRREAETLAAKLHDSEARYRTLFASMDNGYCLIQMIANAEGEWCDYRFLEANPAFIRHTGLPDPVGKTIVELAPDISTSWFRRSSFADVCERAEIAPGERDDRASDWGTANPPRHSRLRRSSDEVVGQAFARSAGRCVRARRVCSGGRGLPRPRRQLGQGPRRGRWHLGGCGDLRSGDQTAAAGQREVQGLIRAGNGAA
ncbi:PAS domain-containing protein [bacterium]|nr:MAG: PAS domain-containing protein [bacterium]